MQCKLHTEVVKLPILDAVIRFAIQYYLQTVNYKRHKIDTSVGMCEQFETNQCPRIVGLISVLYFDLHLL